MPRHQHVEACQVQQARTHYAFWRWRRHIHWQRQNMLGCDRHSVDAASEVFLAEASALRDICPQARAFISELHLHAERVEREVDPEPFPLYT